jgi:hypothetical protein
MQLVTKYHGIFSTEKRNPCSVVAGGYQRLQTAGKILLEVM